MKIKVLDLINTDKSAKELLLNRAVYLQNNYNIENHILCSDGDYIEKLRQNSVKIYIVNTPRNLNLLAIFMATLKTIRIIRKEKYNIIHSHGSVLGIISRLAGLVTKAHVIHTVHGFHFHDNMNKMEYNFFLKVEKIMTRMSDIVLSQNKEDLKLLQSFESKTPVRYIGNGIKIKESKNRIKEMNSEHFKFACIARFEEVKNHQMLFDTMRILKDKGLDFTLKCFGDGHLESYYKNIIRELNLKNNVEFLGYVDNVYECLDDVDLNFLTSIKEGLPRAILETMLMGIPTIATNVKGNNEVVVDSVTGFLTELNNCRHMAEKTMQILHDTSLYNKMSEASQQRVMNHFNEDRICDQLNNVYEEIVSIK